MFRTYLKCFFLVFLILRAPIARGDSWPGSSEADLEIVEKDRPSIDEVQLGGVTQCHADGSYDQELIISHTNGDLAGAIIVNRERFPIEASPQTVILENIAPDVTVIEVAFEDGVGGDPVAINVVAPAIVTGVAALGNFTGCGPGFSFRRQITVFYRNASEGTLELFSDAGVSREVPLTGSPQTVELTFPIREERYGVTAVINGSPCSLTAADLVPSPSQITRTDLGNVTVCYLDGTYDQEIAIDLVRGDADFIIIHGQRFPIETATNGIYNVRGISAETPFIEVEVDGLWCNLLRVPLSPPHFVGRVEHIGATCLDADTYAPVLRVTHEGNEPEGFEFFVNEQSFSYAGVNPQIIQLQPIPRDGVPRDVRVTPFRRARLNCQRVYPGLIAQPFAQSVRAGQSTCNDDGTFDQELIISYTNVPMNSTIFVDNKPFQTTGSPQTIRLTDLSIDTDLSSEIEVSFETSVNDQSKCAQTFRDVFAPLNCNIALTDFILINAETDEEIGALADGDVIDADLLGNPELSIRAITAPNEVGSVLLNLTGTLEHEQVESVSPYALFGDGPRFDYQGEVFPNGNYTLTATPFTSRKGRGDAGETITINFTVMRSGAAPELEFTAILVNADTDEDVTEIQDGDLIDLGVYGEANYTIRYESTAEETQSVVLHLIGDRVNHEGLENRQPYSLYGDARGDYMGALLSNGDHTFSATEYRERGGVGQVISRAQLNFTVRGATVLVQARTSPDRQVEEGEITNISVYPVPAATTLHVKVPLLGNYSVAITDVFGRTFSIGEYEDPQIIELDVRDLDDGIYILRVTNGAKTLKDIRFIKSN